MSFQRTLRLPETGLHALPPGLGRFRLRRVADYPDTAPADWLERGGVMLPVYQREAMWLSFVSSEPAALQVAIGKICAISGTAWREKLRHEPQNYVALPRQPWLDGSGRPHRQRRVLFRCQPRPALRVVRAREPAGRLCRR